MDVKDLAAAKWRHSTAHDSSDHSRLEAALLGDVVITRDSADPNHGIQAYTRAEWAAFTKGVKNGDFDF